MGKRKHDDETPGKEKKSAKKHKKEKKKRKVKKEEIVEKEHVAESPPREQPQEEKTAQTPAIEEQPVTEVASPSAIDSAGRVRSDSMTLEMSYADLAGSHIEDAVDLSGDADNSATTSSSKNKNNKPIFFRKRVQLTVSLLPYSMRNYEASIRDSIRKQLLRHSDGWDGILLAFDNLKYRDRNSSSKGDSNSKGKGWILNELPYIHYEVECDVLVFAPSVGCEVSDASKRSCGDGYQSEFCSRLFLFTAPRCGQ